jgi:hypothetical protein
MEDHERLMELAKLASEEQDPDKLVELVRKITELLDEKHRRLRAQRGSF